MERLLTVLGRTGFTLDSPEPPAPDVRVTWPDGAYEYFEVTEVHPDEVPGHGSDARAEEEQRARRNPQEMATTWGRDPLPAIKHRVAEKAKKAGGYAIGANESLSLLLVAALPKVGAVAATFIFPPFVPAERLNEELHESLAGSRFERAYLHSIVGGALAAWNRSSGWQILRNPDFGDEGLRMIAALKAPSGGGLLPGTQIVGRWP